MLMRRVGLWSVLLAGWLLVATLPAAGQEDATPRALPPTGTADLAVAPLLAEAYPERGYQLAQAGDLDLEGLKIALETRDTVPDAWQPVEEHVEAAYATVYVLLSDRADARSEPLATVTTTILELDGDDAAADGVHAIFDITGYGPTDDVDGVTVYEDVDGVLGVIASGSHVVMVQYADAGEDATRQNTEDWTLAVIADLTRATAERLEDSANDLAELPLGLANVMVTGRDAGWSLPWIAYPTTAHYRVIDGAVTPYAGELASDLEDAVPEGMVDAFVSRQLLGQEGYDQLIDITLARFEDDDAAEAWATDPPPVGFPPTWEVDARHSRPETLDDGTVVERARVDSESLRASGYRAIHREGELVQVVQWLGSGRGVVTEEAVAWLSERQAACLAALPTPCAPVPQDELPVALTPAEGTPGSGTQEGNAIVGPQFGWSVQLPNDDWRITGVEFDTGVEFYQLQSGRSLVTIESAVDHHGDPQQCVLDVLGQLEQLEERSAIDLGSDDPDERPAGLEQDHGWAIYTVEPLQEERADQEYTIRIDCYTLIPDEASLVVTHTAPPDLWTTERDKGERFRDAIQFPASAANLAATPPAGDRRHSGRTLIMGKPRIWISPAA